MPYILFAMGLLSRLIPHIPNATGILFSSLMLGALLTPRKALMITIAMWLSSDILIGLWQNQAIFGSWMFFSYSAVLCLVFLGHSLPTITPFRMSVVLFPTSFLYWVWTNLGVWIFSGMYPFSFSGLIACYAMALPFLKNQLFGDLVLCLFVLLFYPLLRSLLKTKTLTQKFG